MDSQNKGNGDHYIDLLPTLGSLKLDDWTVIGDVKLISFLTD